MNPWKKDLLNMYYRVSVSCLYQNLINFFFLILFFFKNQSFKNEYMYDIFYIIRDIKYNFHHETPISITYSSRLLNTLFISINVSNSI